MSESKQTVTDSSVNLTGLGMFLFLSVFVCAIAAKPTLDSVYEAKIEIAKHNGGCNCNGK